jgi:hypothetical protein
MTMRCLRRDIGGPPMQYRIFTNDRRARNGVPMYSCLKEVNASSPEAARKQCPPQFDAPNYAPAMAVHWPESAQSDHERAWLKKHVGERGQP